MQKPLKMARREESIYMQRWLSFHHYSSPQQSDFYYLKLCNEIYKTLEDDDFPDEELALSDDEKKTLACFITGYFEDVISGPGLWKAFTDQVDELYGTRLPFFDPDPDEYYPDEINPDDINFLLWYFLSMVFRDDTIISPAICEWSELTDEIFEILEREYESAPENLKLKQFLTVSPDEDNYYELNVRMRWIMVDSWMHHFSGQEFDELVADKFSGEEDEPMPEETREEYLYDTMDTFVHSKHTPLLARKGNEWLAYVLGPDHPLFEPVLGMVEKKSGFYLYMGKEGEDQQFQHIATGRELKVTSRSMQLPAGTEPGKSVSFAGFVQWKGRWWFSGALVDFGYDANLIRSEKESEESKTLFGKDPDMERAENRQFYPSFLKFNHGTPLAFVESEEAANSFIRDLLAYHNRSAGRSARKRRKQRELTEQEVLPGRPGDITDSGPEEAITGMIFCDPDGGTELAFGYNDLISDPRNSWYVENDYGGDDDEEAMMLLESVYISEKWVQYLVANYDLPGLEFPGMGGRDLLMDNLDFMLRFWKEKGYHCG